MESNFNPLEDAKAIKQSITKPRNLNSLIQIVAHRSNAQRQEIKKEYFNLYQKNLIEDLRSELKGNFEELIVSLFYTPIDFDCYQLHKAMDRLGTNEDTLIEILASRSNEEIRKIKQRYFDLYNKELIKDVEGDTSGYFRQILLKLLQANRSENPYPDEKECIDCARKIYTSMTKEKKEVMQNTFQHVFTLKSREELALIAKKYYSWYNDTLIDIIRSKFKSDTKRIFKAIIYSILSPSEYFAYRINKAIKKLGTNDTILIRIIVSRDEIDMYRIKRYYKQLYNNSLYDDVKKDTSGDYRNLLLEIIGK